MKNNKISTLALIFPLVACLTLPLFGDKFVDRVEESTSAYKALIKAKDGGVPASLLEKCQCVVVIPHVIKAAFGFGGRHGNGIASCKGKKGKWSPLSFVKLSGGSFGFQIGVQSSDMVLFLMTDKSIQGLLGNKFTLGADASVAAGPVGRSVAADTDITLRAEIYSYARSKGLFAGISLEGASLRADNTAIKKFYGQEVEPKAILIDHKVPNLPYIAREFTKALP
ncbi:MAG: lipid-binding SYLF domain-containing protein [Acidobacteria bacterium]|nr:lipid-binding SYLF domain-containing protein [Acidobacteriota bacterium]